MAAGMVTVTVLNVDTFHLHDSREEDIDAYAKHIGIDVEVEEDLMWIAEAGLRTGVPSPWVPCQMLGREDVFFFNPVTRVSSWDHPCDNLHRQLVQKYHEEGVVVVITLRAEVLGSSTVRITGTNLAGVEVVNQVVDSGSHFGDIRKMFKKHLSQRDGVSTRFVLPDCAVLGRSSNSKTISDIFLTTVRL